jgi:hypothetical protein
LKKYNLAYWRCWYNAFKTFSKAHASSGWCCAFGLANRKTFLFNVGFIRISFAFSLYLLQSTVGINEQKLQVRL